MSSKRAIRRKSCTGKQRHSTMGQAYGHIASLVRAKGDQGRLRPYNCKFCSFIHIGHAGGRP